MTDAEQWQAQILAMPHDELIELKEFLHFELHFGNSEISYLLTNPHNQKRLFFSRKR
jgi:hypothetical protein